MSPIGEKGKNTKLNEKQKFTARAGK